MALLSESDKLNKGPLIMMEYNFQGKYFYHAKDHHIDFISHLLFIFFNILACVVSLLRPLYRIPQIECLKQQKHVFSQFQSLKAQDQGAHRVGFWWDLSS